MPPENDDLSVRDALETAFEEPTADVTPTPEPVVDEGAEADAGEPASEGPQRDEKGRFAPSDKLGEPGEPPTQGIEPKTAETAPAEPAEPAPEELKAPQSYSPAAREHWAALPREVQSEIVRRERDQERVLQESAQSRGFMDAFERTVRPFEAFIAAEQSNPLQAVHNLMTAAARLRTDPPAQKAALVAGMIAQYGVDVRMLDAALAGQPVPQGQPQQPPHDPRVDQLLQERQMMLQQWQAQQQGAAQKEIEAFRAKAEFLDDVRDTMADLIEVASKQGRELTLQQAYDQACRLNTEVSTIIDKRKQTESLKSADAAAKKAKKAAVSIRGTTPEVGATGEEPDSIRDALEQAFASARG